MIQAQAQKYVGITPPAAIVDNAAFTTASVDTLGYDYAQVIVYFGAMDIAIAAMKLRESDDDSTYTDVTGGDYSGSLPSASADNTFYAWNVDLRGKKRYLDVSLTGGDGTAGTYATVIAVLSRGATNPSSATGRGFAAELTC